MTRKQHTQGRKASQRACCAARARAEGGSPATTSLSVTNFRKALVASSTLLLNLVLSCDSSSASALKRSLSAPCPPQRRASREVLMADRSPIVWSQWSYRQSPFSTC